MPAAENTPVRGWGRAGAGSRATARSCSCLCGWLSSPEVCWYSGTDAPSLWGLLVDPAQRAIVQGGQRICKSLQAPSCLVIFTLGSTCCCFFDFSCCFTSLSFLFFLPLHVWFGCSDHSVQSCLAAKRLLSKQFIHCLYPPK